MKGDFIPKSFALQKNTAINIDENNHTFVLLFKMKGIF